MMTVSGMKAYTLRALYKTAVPTASSTGYVATAGRAWKPCSRKDHADTTDTYSVTLHHQ